MRRTIAWLVALLLVASCAPSKERHQLDLTKGFVVKRLLEIRRDGAQYTMYGELVVSGTNAHDFIMTGAPPGLAPVIWEAPPEPWSLRLSNSANWRVDVDLYGDDLGKPLDHMQIDMRR